MIKKELLKIKPLEETTDKKELEGREKLKKTREKLINDLIDSINKNFELEHQDTLKGLDRWGEDSKFITKRYDLVKYQIKLLRKIISYNVSVYNIYELKYDVSSQLWVQNDIRKNIR